jgi:hypothetical protein
MRPPSLLLPTGKTRRSISDFLNNLFRHSLPGAIAAYPSLVGETAADGATLPVATGSGWYLNAGSALTVSPYETDFPLTASSYVICIATLYYQRPAQCGKASFDALAISATGEAHPCLWRAAQTHASIFSLNYSQCFYVSMRRIFESSALPLRRKSAGLACGARRSRAQVSCLGAIAKLHTPSARSDYSVAR